MKPIALAGLFASVLLTAPISAPLWAQETVEPAENIEQLFTSEDPQLHANKQIVYRILLELLEAGHWDRAEELLSEDYIQHNPNAKSGRAAVVAYFTKVLKVEPSPIPESLGMKVVAVMAEGDLVTVLYRRTVSDAAVPGGSYTTTWYDTWRIEDGRAAQHWDPALLGEAPDLQ